MGRKTDAVLAVLNGAVGDYLARTANGLATEMVLVDRVRGGEALRGEGVATRQLAIFVHGLMAHEGCWQLADGTDYGTLLARDLGLTPTYLRYNSGVPIATNGVAFAALLEALVASLPAIVDEVILVGHSLGGLVIRAACHHGRLHGHAWLARVKCAAYLGTPHRGAPLERAGRIVEGVLQRIDDPVTRLGAQLADLRAAGIKDLGDAALRHEDRGPMLNLADARHPVPLLPEIHHFLVAGSVTDNPLVAAFFGDAMVSLPSATDGLHDPWARGHKRLMSPDVRVELVPGIGHASLTRHLRVYEALRRWLADELGTP